MFAEQVFEVFQIELPWPKETSKLPFLSASSLEEESSQPSCFQQFMLLSKLAATQQSQRATLCLKENAVNFFRGNQLQKYLCFWNFSILTSSL